MAKRYYELHVSGCTRHLPVLNISDKVAIAGFVILGDVEIVENTARDLAAKVPKDCEYVMTAETKGIPLLLNWQEIWGRRRTWWRESRSRRIWMILSV